MRERKPGQDGQEDLDPVRHVTDPRTGESFLAVDADDWLRRRTLSEEKDTDVGVYVSPSATLGADTPGRGRSTKPRIPPVDSP